MQTKDAAFFYKKAQNNKAAAQLYEEAGEFEAALNLYYRDKMYEEAANAIERCQVNFISFSFKIFVHQYKYNFVM